MHVLNINLFESISQSCITLGTKAIPLDGAIVNVINNTFFTLRPFKVSQYAYITIDTGKAVV